MLRRSLKLSLLILVLLASALQSALAGTINGTVSAVGVFNFMPLQGVAVKAVLQGKRGAQTAMTDGNGQYSLQNLTNGAYTVTYKVNKFLPVTTAITVQDGTWTFNVGMVPHLQLTSVASNDPTLTRRWRLSNPLPVAVGFSWAILNSTNTGIASTDPGPLPTFFETPTVSGTNTASVVVGGVEIGRVASTGKTANRTKANLTVAAIDSLGNGVPDVNVGVTIDGSGVTTNATTQDDGTCDFTQLAVKKPVTISVTGANGVVTAHVSSLHVGDNSQVITIGSPPASLVVSALNSFDGSPIGGASVHVMFSDGEPSQDSVTDGDGNASFLDLPVGVGVTITIVKDLGSGTFVINQLEPGENDAFVAVNFPATPVATLNVTVVDPKQAPVNGATVTVQANDGSTSTASTDGSGLATFQGLALGPATVTVQHPSGNALPVTTTLAAGSNALSVVTAPTVTTLTVTVLSDDGITFAEGATVTVGSQTGTTDANGVAVLSVPVGPATVNATSGTDTGSQLANLTGTTDQVTVQLHPPQPPTGTVTVTVVRGDGNPSANATVTITFADSSPSLTGQADANGTITFTGVETGVAATVTANGTDSATASVNLSSGFAVGQNPETLTTS